MIKAGIDDVARDLRQYLRRVREGQIILIEQDNRSIAEIRPAGAHPQTPRPAGLCAGEFTVPDHFDDPLPDDVLKGFEGA